MSYSQPGRQATSHENPTGCLSVFLFPPLAVVFMGILLTFVLSQANGTVDAASETLPANLQTGKTEAALANSNPAEAGSGGANIFVAPYKSYTITQGLHGFSYGHMAIDLAAGKGATIYSPINGTVKALYIDQYGNPTLVIENKSYKVTMLHGDYSVSEGQKVEAGQAVGSESNHGYTTDMQGQPCAGRDCGYHTHLNVFDKRNQTNINPLDLLGK